MTARHFQRDICTLALVVLTIILGISLVTYDRADAVPELAAPLDRLYQPDQLVEPPHATPHNACGRLGALLADVALTLLGVAAYPLVVVLGLHAWRRLRRQPTETPVLRAVGTLSILLSLATLAALLLPNWSPGPVIGAGGYAGGLLAHLLHQQFATAGAVIVAGSTLFAGLLLVVDEEALAAFRRAATAVQPASKWMLRRLPRSAQADTTRTDVSPNVAGNDSDDEEWEEMEAEADEEWEEASTDDAERDEHDEQEERRAPAVRIKRRKRRKKPPAAPVDEREQVMNQLDQASIAQTDSEYDLPSLDLLLEPDDACFEEQAKEVRRKAQILEKTFADFGFNVRVVEVETGPVIAQYEVELEAGLRLAKITGLADDLAIALRVPSVRIVAPIPGKNTIGIEVPNATRQIVRLREVMEETVGKWDKMKIPLFLGKDVSGNPILVDLATMPHLLIAGRTGTGKSVCLNTIISSMLMTRRPDEVRLLLVDPKMVELSGYGRLPHLMHPVVTDMRKAEAILAWAVEKMEERYALLARTGVRHITSYNELSREERHRRLQPADQIEADAIPDKLPFIVIVADEIADLMMTAGKDVEQHIIRLAQKSRAVGIHLILATQKPTVDVITGLIKSNLPARISFQVASRTDSRVVLDEMGAEKLLGYGDMLFLWPGTSMLIRGQGTYLSDDEIQNVVDAVSTGEQQFVQELISLEVKDDDGDTTRAGKLKKRDELYEQAVDIVVREGRGSVSLLQRCLGIGYGRAARLIDFMAEDGVVGEYAGSQAREVLISIAEWERMQRGDDQDDHEVDDEIIDEEADDDGVEEADEEWDDEEYEEDDWDEADEVEDEAGEAAENDEAPWDEEDSAAEDEAEWEEDDEGDWEETDWEDDGEDDLAESA